MIRPFRGTLGRCLLLMLVSALVAGGLAWVTYASLGVETAQRAAAAQAERMGQERIALWRLDGKVLPVIGVENSRPYEQFTALYTPPDVPGANLNNTNKANLNNIRFLSPLTSADVEPWLLLHVQLDPEQGWLSPQVMNPDLANQLRDEPYFYDLKNVDDLHRDRLAALTLAFPVKEAIVRFAEFEKNNSAGETVTPVTVSSNPVETERMMKDIDLRKQADDFAMRAPQSNVFKTEYYGTERSLRRNEATVPYGNTTGKALEDSISKPSINNAGRAGINQTAPGNKEYPTVEPQGRGMQQVSQSPPASQQSGVRGGNVENEIPGSEKSTRDSITKQALDKSRTSSGPAVVVSGVPQQETKKDTPDVKLLPRDSRSNAPAGPEGAPQTAPGPGNPVAPTAPGNAPPTTTPANGGPPTRGAMPPIHLAVAPPPGGGSTKPLTPANPEQVTPKPTAPASAMPKETLSPPGPVFGGGFGGIGGAGGGRGATRQDGIKPERKENEDLSKKGDLKPGEYAVKGQTREGGEKAAGDTLDTNRNKDAAGKNSTSNSVLQRGEGNLGLNLDRAFENRGKNRPTPPPVGVHLGTMRPIWLKDNAGNDQLFLIRTARLADKTVYQGALIDWPHLKETLKNDVQDLFPDSTLHPWEPNEEAQNERTMSALPILMDPGPAPALPEAGWTPLRIGLVLAWAAALIAIIAVWLGGWSLATLSERRIRFVSAVTHELRTPLTSLRLYLDMLTSGMVTEEKTKTEYLNTLSTESDRLNRLIENVLDFARLERRGVPVKRETVAAGSILDGLKETWAERVASEGKELVCLATVPTEQTVSTDPRMALQVLGNLIDNARKYTREAADPRIWVWVKPASRGWIAFEVEDRGPGVATAERRTIFRAFRRGNDAESVAGGVGLGLALAHQWTDLLGGKLSYRPAEGGIGACFRLELPV